MALIKKPETPPIPKKWQEAAIWKATRCQRPLGQPLLLCLSRGRWKDYEIISYGADRAAEGTGKNADVSSADLSKD